MPISLRSLTPGSRLAFLLLIALASVGIDSHAQVRAASGVPVTAPQGVPSAPENRLQRGRISPARLERLFEQAKAEFWAVEPTFNNYDNPIKSLPPLSGNEADAAQYRHAAQVAEAFLRVQARAGQRDSRTPVMLYLGAMAYSRIGADEPALNLINRLLAEYPDYHYPRQPDAARFDRPVRGTLLHLKLYHLNRLLASQIRQQAAQQPKPQGAKPPVATPTALPHGAPANPSKPIATTKPTTGLPQPTKTPAPTTSVTPASAPTPHAPTSTPTPKSLPAPLDQPPLQALASIAQDGADAFAEEGTLRASAGFAGALEYSAPTPDQLRSAALPEIGTLVMQLHDVLLPRALQKDGPKAVRDYLRTLAGSGKPFAGYAYLKLLDIDKAILAQYQGEADKARNERRWGDAKAWLQRIMAEYDGLPAGLKAKGQLAQVVLAEYQDGAQKAMNEHRFADARTLYRHIIAEYTGTTAAQQAQADLQNTVSVAVAYYKSQGDINFQPAKQVGVPQAKAREYFEKMFNEDPQGPMADYALLQWSRALATEGKSATAIEQLQRLVQQYPTSENLPQAMFLLGFYEGNSSGRYAEALKWFDRTVKEYPNSQQASESLWYAAFFALSTKRPQDGLAYLEKLEAYPQSKRFAHIEELRKALTSAVR